jgi:hypothetical protein
MYVAETDTLPAAFLGHTVARCMTAICGATILAVCRDAETDPRVERHTATRLTLWVGDWLLQAFTDNWEFSCACSTSKGPCLGCIRLN